MPRWNRTSLLAALDEKMTQLGYRNPYQLPVDPFAIAEKQNIAVSYKPFPDDHIGGWVFKTEHASSVVLNGNRRAQWIFTLMHELIHIWFHPCGMYYDRTDSEGIHDIQANYAAAEALMPTELVHEIAAELNYDVSYTAHAFGVSREAMAIRFSELGVGKVKKRRENALYSHNAELMMAAEDSSEYK